MRSIDRGINIVTTRLAELPEMKLTEQESKDTLTITTLLLMKYTPTVLSQYYLETTALVHFATLFADRLIAYRQAKTKKVKEEKEAVEKMREREKERAEAEAKTKAKEEEEKAKAKTESIPSETKEGFASPKTLPHLTEEQKKKILGG